MLRKFDFENVDVVVGVCFDEQLQNDSCFSLGRCYPDHLDHVVRRNHQNCPFDTIALVADGDCLDWDGCW